MQSVKLSNNLEVIGNYTFNSCSSLQEITIPASVASIEQNAFSGAPLSKVYFENTEGWQHGKPSGTWSSIDPEDLVDPTEAAELLLRKYSYTAPAGTFKELHAWRCQK